VTHVHTTGLLSLAAMLVVGCSLSPLHRKIKVGEEPFVVFVATGTDGKTDLFASPPSGGDPVRLTFTAMTESLPRLTSQGDMVAFLRDRMRDGAQDLVVMNLLSGAERVVELPGEAGVISALGWSRDASALYLQASSGRWRVTAPPANLVVTLLDGSVDFDADSALMTLLGNPSFARAEACAGGGICVIGPSGIPSQVSTTGTAPFRWGSDSVAWFDGGMIVVRPLGAGTSRRLSWTTGIEDPQGGSYAEP
jgi:hypothetical protein